MKKFPLLSELTEMQKRRMAYLIDRHTYAGLITAGRIVRGEFDFDKNRSIREIFEALDLTPAKAALRLLLLWHLLLQ